MGGMVGGVRGWPAEGVGRGGEGCGRRKGGARASSTKRRLLPIATLPAPGAELPGNWGTRPPTRACGGRRAGEGLRGGCARRAARMSAEDRPAFVRLGDARGPQAAGGVPKTATHSHVVAAVAEDEGEHGRGRGLPVRPSHCNHVCRRWEGPRAPRVSFERTRRDIQLLSGITAGPAA